MKLLSVLIVVILAVVVLAWLPGKSSEKSHDDALTAYAKDNIAAYLQRTGNPQNVTTHISPSVVKEVMAEDANGFVTTNTVTIGELKTLPDKGQL